MNRRPKALSFSGGGTKFAWQIEVAEEWLSCSRSLAVEQAFAGLALEK